MKYAILFISFLQAFLLCAQNPTTLAGHIQYGGDNSRIKLTVNQLSQQSPVPIPISAEGVFEVDLSKYITEPTQIDLRIQLDSLTDRWESITILLAPAYRLFLQADIDIATHRVDRKEMRMTGEGQEINNLLYQKLFSYYVGHDIAPPVDEYIGALNRAVNSMELALDSLDQNHPGVPYLQDWKSLLITDISYSNLNQFVVNYAFNNGLSTEQIMTSLPKLGFSDFWEQVNDSQSLRSRSFRQFLGQINFLESEGLLAYPASVVAQYEGQPLADVFTMNTLFSDEVRAEILYQDIRKRILRSRKLADIQLLNEVVGLIENELYRQDLNELSTSIVNSIGEIVAGNIIASDIMLRDERTGELVNLKEIAGKVIFLEAWASWCGPCRGEIPYLKKLKEHYRDNKDIIFISVASSNDKQEARKKIIADQQMDWLLLEDSDDHFSDFFQISAIPHTVILTGDGKIVDNDGIRPSSPHAISYLDALLNEDDEN